MNELRSIACPDCKDRTDRHKFCERCYGSGKIVLAEQLHKVPLDKAALWQWGLLCFVVVTVILIAVASR